MSSGVGCRCGLCLVLLWLWCRPAVQLWFDPSLESSICHGCGPKRTKKKKIQLCLFFKKYTISLVLLSVHSFHINLQCHPFHITCCHKSGNIFSSIIWLSSANVTALLQNYNFKLKINVLWTFPFLFYFNIDKLFLTFCVLMRFLVIVYQYLPKWDL